MCQPATHCCRGIYKVVNTIFRRCTRRCPKSQKSKSTKRSKLSSETRTLVELQLGEQELESYAEALKRVLEAKMKVLQIEEVTSKKVQAVKDKTCSASNEDNESDNDPKESVVSAKESAATKTAK